MKSAIGVSGALLAAILAGCSHAPAPPAPGPHGDPGFDRTLSIPDFDAALLSRALFQETNRARIEHGAPPLRSLPGLDHAADMQVAYLALTLTVGHMSMFPHEHDLGQRIRKVGLRAALAGENAIMMPARRAPYPPMPDFTYLEYADFLVEGWMNSPDHRETMMDHRYTRFGCAARLSNALGKPGERIFAVQVFFLPEDEAQPQASRAPRPLNPLASAASAP